MKTIVKMKEIEVLEMFARKIPNAEKMFVDFGRDSLLIQFGQYTKEYSIKEILDNFQSLALKTQETIVEFY